MGNGIKEQWRQDKRVAEAILHVRQLRRRFLGLSLALALIMFVLGLWGVDAWLAAESWRFLLWWGACGLVSLWVIIFALYDTLMTLREQLRK